MILPQWSLQSQRPSAWSSITSSRVEGEGLAQDLRARGRVAPTSSPTRGSRPHPRRHQAGGLQARQGDGLGIDAASSIRTASSSRPNRLQMIDVWNSSTSTRILEEAWPRTLEGGDCSPTVGQSPLHYVFVTDPERLGQGHPGGRGTAILIKVNQIGSLSETFDGDRDGQAGRLPKRHLPPLRRDRGHDHRRHRRGDLRGPDQDRRHLPDRPGGQVQPAPADRGRARGLGHLSLPVLKRTDRAIRESGTGCLRALPPFFLHAMDRGIPLTLPGSLRRPNGKPFPTRALHKNRRKR